MSMKASESVVMLRIARGSKSETRVSLDSFDGRTFVNLRLWFMAPNGVWGPTRRGVTFEVEDLHDLQRAVHEAIQRTTGGKA